MTAPARLRAVDPPAGHRRTLRALVGSLVARLATLSAVTGGQAIGSHLAGIAALGREVARTDDGRRLLAGLDRSRAGANGEALWHSLRIGGWLSAMPPSPVLDELRNDLALLLADDIDSALESTRDPANPEPPPTAPLAKPHKVEFPDLMLGLWAWGHELSRSVEAAAGNPSDEPQVTVAPGEGPVLDGPVLR
jgi:hypothetical protein